MLTICKIKIGAQLVKVQVNRVQWKIQFDIFRKDGMIERSETFFNQTYEGIIERWGCIFDENVKQQLLLGQALISSNADAYWLAN